MVSYAGVPSETLVDGYSGWTRTTDGALAVNEPESAWWWFPSNDHPLDKATWDVSVSVPDGVEVISNGVQPRPAAGRGRQPDAVELAQHQAAAPRYLAFLAIGQYDIVTDTAPNGQPVINAYSTTLGERGPAARASIERTAEIVDWESGIFGPYPFEAQGGVAAPIDGLELRPGDADPPGVRARLLATRRQPVRGRRTRTPTSGSATRSRWRTGATSG